MRLIDADKLMDYCRNHKNRSADCNDIARFPTVNAIPISVIENIMAEIQSLRGCSCEWSDGIIDDIEDIIDKHLGKEQE